jgi:hypothetical protein
MAGGVVVEIPNLRSSVERNNLAVLVVNLYVFPGTVALPDCILLSIVKLSVDALGSLALRVTVAVGYRQFMSAVPPKVEGSEVIAFIGSLIDLLADWKPVPSQSDIELVRASMHAGGQHMNFGYKLVVGRARLCNNGVRRSAPITHEYSEEKQDHPGRNADGEAERFEDLTHRSHRS